VTRPERSASTHRPEPSGGLGRQAAIVARDSMAIFTRGVAAIVTAALASSIAATTAQARSDLPRAAQPEAATGSVVREAVRGSRWMAVTANRHASAAAAAMLAAGGSATDAAIAAQMVLTLVEPQSSGIGGGAFLIHYEAKQRQLAAWDGRETAPAAADESLLLDAAGRPLPFFDAIVGGRSVGVPGLVRMLERAHERHGRLPWSQLFGPAISLAREGFAVSPRLHALLERDPALRGDPEAAALFYDGTGRAHPVGHRLRNPALADTLSRIARQGSLALHAGPIARDIVDRVRNHPANPGLLGERDLAFYRPVERQALCFEHGRYRVCGMPPPSSGGIAVAQMLKMWRMTPAQGPVGDRPLRLAGPSGRLDPAGAHRFAEIGRLAFADRDRYVADTDFVPIPGGPAALLDDGYLARRAALIGERAMQGAEPGQPASAALRSHGPSASLEQPATSHLSIVDAQGNAVSMTSSIESAFGSRIMIRGFLLNNQLTDFSFAPAQDGRPVANRVQPNKRPRSSMAPTIVFDRASGALELVIGSPGGPAIIHHVARSLIAILDDGLDPQTAVSLPNLGNRNGPTELEKGAASDALADALRARGHQVALVEMPSGLHAIALDCKSPPGHDRDCTLTGAVDPRREGAAVTAPPIGER